MSNASEILTQLWFKLDQQHKDTLDKLDKLELAKPYEVSRLCGRLDQLEQTCRDITQMLREIHGQLDNCGPADGVLCDLGNRSNSRGSNGS